MIHKMHTRLRKARINAVCKTATEAIKACGWRNSAWRAYENGQNNFKIGDAELYTKPDGLTPAWLLIGAERGASGRSVQTSYKKHRPDSIEPIYATALLLRDDPTNWPRIMKLIDCVHSQLL